MSQADNSVKNKLNLPTSNPKSDFHTINAHTKFGKNPLACTQIVMWKHGQTYDRRVEGQTDRQPT